MHTSTDEFGRETTVIGDRKYRLSSLHDNSNKYGNCEVCGKYASEVFLQGESRLFYSPISKDMCWTYNGCFKYFGHKECLISKRKGIIKQR